MQDTQSIRPEIKGLFDTIREQSIKYNEAFEHLERQTYAYRLFMNELNELADNVKTTLNNKIRNIDVKVEDSIRVLKLETAKTINKYTELKDLKYLQDSYQHAIDAINQIKETFDRHIEVNKRIVNEFERTLADFKKKSNNELEIFIVESQTKINTIAANEFAKLEDKIAIRQRQIEGRLVGFDQNFWSNTERVNNELKQLGKEFDGMKSIISSINHMADEQAKKLKLQFDATNEKMETRIEFLNELIKDFEFKLANFEKNSSDKNKTGTHFNVVKTDSENRIYALEKRVTEILAEFDTSQKNDSMPKIVSIISLFLSISAIVIAFFL